MGSDRSLAPNVLLDTTVWLSKSSVGVPLSRAAMGQCSLQAEAGVSGPGAAGLDSFLGLQSPWLWLLVPGGPVCGVGAPDPGVMGSPY